MKSRLEACALLQVRTAAVRPRADPDETEDLAANPRHAAVLAECRAKLYSICDPDEVDRKAKARQAELLAANGGREAVIARGDLGFTPAPGFAADFE